LLYQVCDQIRQHAGKRREAFLPLIKGSQAEIMAITADLDLTLSQGRILLELERTGEALAVNDLSSRISLSIAAAGLAIDALYRSGLHHSMVVHTGVCISAHDQVRTNGAFVPRAW
jgi:hypothetical protein